MGYEFQRQRNLLVALLVVALLGIAMPAGASGAGGAGGVGGAGGGGGELIGVAQEADSLCCCTVPVEGSMMSCQVVASPTCPPYTTDFPGACDSSPPSSGNSKSCFASVVPSGAGGMDAAFVLLLALAALRTVRRRFA